MDGLGSERSGERPARSDPGRLALNAVCWIAIAAATAAAVRAWPGLERQRYLELGLWTLASRRLWTGVAEVLPLAIPAGLAVALSPLLVARLRRIVEARALRLVSLLLASCLAGTGLIALGALQLGSGPRPSILLISVDTLRADHLGAYGYRRPTSPHIDRLAAEGVLFRHAVAQASWTLPSMASALTGLYPSQHGAIHSRTRLGASALTLAEVLRDAGYRTLAVVSHLFVSARYGFAQGVDEFEEIQLLEHDTVTSERTTQVASEWLAELEGAPFFFWVHYFDPHYSYMRHPERGFAGRTYTTRVTVEQLLGWQRALSDPDDPANVNHPRIREAADIYDEEIAHTDAWVGRLVENARSSIGGPLLIVFTSDHGELFMERGDVGHGRDVYEELIHVPLVFAGDVPPERRGTVVRRTVELASLPFTLARYAGIEPNPFPGEDLLLPDGSAEPRPAFSEGTRPYGDRGRKRSVTLDGWKLIEHFDDGTRELYHLASEDGEGRDLWGDEGAGARIRARLLEQLATFPRAAVDTGREVELDEDERARLRMLGYAE